MWHKKRCRELLMRSLNMYSIQQITTRETWDSFLIKVQPNTFLHSWHWGEFQQGTGEKVWRLGIYEGDALQGIALIIKVSARRGSFLFCPHGPIGMETLKHG